MIRVAGDIEAVIRLLTLTKKEFELSKRWLLGHRAQHANSGTVGQVCMVVHPADIVDGIELRCSCGATSDVTDYEVT